MATTRRTRETIVQGIYKDAHGITVIARIGSTPNLLTASTRFPLIDDDGIPYSKRNCAELIKCRLRLHEDLRRQQAKAHGEAGSLGATIDAYLVAHPYVKGGPRKPADDADFLAHWRRADLAAVPVADLKRSQIKQQLQAWTDEGRPPSSVNHRRRVLGDVLRWHLGADDDVDVVIATDGIARVRERKAEARGILIPVLVRILATLPDRGRPVKGEARATYSETKIRLRVMAWTGLAHKSLERLERRRVNFREGKLFLPARQKGQGAEGVWMDLLPAAIDALRDYDRAELWGRAFSRSSMYRSWQRAIRTLRAELQAEAERTGDRTRLDQFLATVPANSYPYDTRHSFLSEAYRQSGDLKAVKELAQHGDIKTTERYTKAAVPERVASAIEKMRAHWFPDAPKPGATVRDFKVIEKG